MIIIIILIRCTSLKLSDDVSSDSRFNALCGAMAHQYDAQWMTEISRHITNRNVFLAGGCQVDARRAHH
jgi:hypothetical protein